MQICIDMYMYRFRKRILRWCARLTRRIAVRDIGQTAKKRQMMPTSTQFKWPQEWDYTRRSKVFESAMYPPNGHTGIRGQFLNVMQRTEYQRLGPEHRHINEFPVTCGRLLEMPTLPMTRDSTQDSASALGVPSYLTTHERLRGKKTSAHLTTFKKAEDVTKDKQRLCPGFQHCA